MQSVRSISFWWLPADALAWAFGMPVIIAGVHVVAATPDTGLAALAAAVTIAAAGAVVGAIHGAVLLWLCRGEGPRAKACGRIRYLQSRSSPKWPVASWGMWRSLRSPCVMNDPPLEFHCGDGSRETDGLTLNAMKHLAHAAAALLVVGIAQAEPARFVRAAVLNDGGTLHLYRADGSHSVAPRFGEQDGFGKPAVAADFRHVGWLALYPGMGASYSQPIHLVVLDTTNQLRMFSGDFGMVFEWCFARSGQAVVYRYSFPHGPTPVVFEMRRIEDGKRLRRFEVDPGSADQDPQGRVRWRVPPWAGCLQMNAAAN